MLNGRAIRYWGIGAVVLVVAGCASAPPRLSTQPPPEPLPERVALPEPVAPVAVAGLGVVPEPRIGVVESFPSAAAPVAVAPAQRREAFAEQREEPAAIDTFLGPAVADPPAPSPRTAQAVVDELGSRDFDIPIPLNDRVLSFVELFSGRLKGYLEEGLGRGTRYLPMVQSIFQAEGVPLDLAYVPLIESAFKPSALSRAKARGIWQFMRGTALENGLRHNWYLDERADPEKATRAAARYLKFLYDKFGDWHLALASYNGGWGRVQRAMKRSGKTDFWELSAGRRILPRETRDYVPLILAAVIVARNPIEYGLAIQPSADVPSELVAMAAPTDLRRVAEWTGTSLDVLQDLNPELRRWTTPAHLDDYQLRVPMGTADALRQRMGELTSDAPDPFAWHVVRKGETPAGIAKKLRVSKTDLVEANYLSARARLTAGQRLIVPRPPALLDATGEPVTVLALAGGGDGDVVGDAAASRRRPAAAAETSRVVHRVRRGETLMSIARRYSTNVASIRDWNRLRSTRITVGQRLTIHRRSSTQAD
jgi:membrane-bound lytic murein transglycosylase D